jgi:hypothetical protein
MTEENDKSYSYVGSISQEDSSSQSHLDENLDIIANAPSFKKKKSIKKSNIVLRIFI